LQAGYPIGSILASGVWLAIGSSGPGAWRYMYLIGVLPALIVFWIRRNIPESPRWEESNRRRRAAYDLRRQGAALEGQNAALVRFIAILVRGDSHYGRDEAMEWCENHNVNYVFGFARNDVLHALTREAADAICVQRALSGEDKCRGFKAFRFGPEHADSATALNNLALWLCLLRKRLGSRAQAKLMPSRPPQKFADVVGAQAQVSTGGRRSLYLLSGV
jgi:hypothetical protein